MAVTDRQRNVVSDIKASVGYFKAHENVDKATLSGVLRRAGIENQGNFYNVVNSFKKKWDKDPEAKQLVRELKETLASVGIVPVYLEDVRTYTRKASGGEETLELEPETFADLKEKARRKVNLQLAPKDPEPIVREPRPLLGTFQQITEGFDPVNEVHALNLTIFALQGLPQLKRENVMQAVAGLFGLGSAY